MVDSVSTDEPNKDNDLVSNFIESITQADGKLRILPGLTSRVGEPLFMSVRFGQDEFTPDEIQYLNVDIFAQRGESYMPVGIYDWEIEGTVATGNKQRHQHLPKMNKAQETADRYWSTGEAFHVRDDSFLNYAEQNGGLSKMSEMRRTGIIRDEQQWMERVYQGLGIGGLMIAVSALTLNRYGITEMNLGTLSPQAVQAWERFEIGDSHIISPGEIVNKPAMGEILSKALDQH